MWQTMYLQKKGVNNLSSWFMSWTLCFIFMCRIPSEYRSRGSVLFVKNVTDYQGNFFFSVKQKCVTDCHLSLNDFFKR